MKKKFNFICVLIIATIVCGVLLPQVYTYSLIFDGNFMENAREAKAQSQFNPGSEAGAIELIPKKFPFARPDSIYNKRTGRYDRMMVLSALVDTNQPKSAAFFQVWVSALGIVNGILTFVCLTFFAKIVLAVRRGEIFLPKIERWMRYCGFALIGCYACQWAILLSNYFHNLAMFELEHYNISFNTWPSLYVILSGLGLLMIAELFAIARKMQEEQALTI